MASDIQLDYSAAEDRVLLTLVMPEGARRYWLTRRQCVALVLACRGASGEAPPLRVGAPIETDGGSVVKRRDEEVQLETPDELRVAGPVPEQKAHLVRLGLGRADDRVRLTLEEVESGNTKPLSLLLNPAEQLGLVRSLRHLGSRAQWDLDAAESRAAVNAVLGKASRKKTD